MTAWIITANTNASDMDGSDTRLKRDDTVRATDSAITLTIDIAVSNTTKPGLGAGNRIGGAIG